MRKLILAAIAFAVMSPAVAQAQMADMRHDSAPMRDTRGGMVHDRTVVQERTVVRDDRSPTVRTVTRVDRRDGDGRTYRTRSNQSSHSQREWGHDRRQWSHDRRDMRRHDRRWERHHRHHRHHRSW